MSDTYQAIYDAARSRISGGNIGEAVEAALRSADIGFWASHAAQVIAQEAGVISQRLTRPSAIYRPTLTLDGNQYCVLYGPNLQEGIAGFGDTAAEAMADFDERWENSKLPQPKVPA